MSKDRGYITATEWKTEGGGYKDKMQGVPFRRLPFNCCAVSFLPFEDPVCTADGTVMDIMHAVPYVQTHGKHPVTGEPLQLRDLTKLNFHKNSEGEYECPVLNKVFTDSTHIVAVKTSGNVYCYQAIDELCIKPKNWKDLITDEKFTRKDLITIQDPLNLEGRMLDKFEHVKKGHEIDTRGGGVGDADDNLNSRAMSADVKRVLEKLGTEDAAAALKSGGGGRRAEAERILAEAKHKSDADAKGDSQATVDKSHLLKAPTNHPLDNVTFKPGSHTWNTDGPEDWRVTHAKAADGEQMKKREAEMRERFKAVGSYISYRTNSMRTTGAGSTSFTSTVMGSATVNERVEEVVKRNPPKGKKGYVQLRTNLGDINIELHCDVAPRTCENFIVLCKAGYYDGVEFHRSIKNFMIQGGDPTGTGSGASASGVTSSRTRSPTSCTTDAGYFPWPTVARTPTGPSFLSRIRARATSTGNTPCLVGWWAAWTCWPRWSACPPRTTTGRRNPSSSTARRYSPIRTRTWRRRRRGLRRRRRPKRRRRRGSGPRRSTRASGGRIPPGRWRRRLATTGR